MTITKKQRVDSLKTLAKLAKKYLNYYKELNIQKTNNWVLKKSEGSILQLKEIITQINKDLHPKKVESYCKPFPGFEGISVGEVFSKKKSEETNIINEFLTDHLEQTNFNFTLVDIARLAPEQNIIHDITWLSEGTLKDIIEIGLGIKNVEYFEIYLSAKIEETEKYLLPYFTTKNGFSEKIKLIQQAIHLSKEENFLASNILLITVTESIVRETCKFIYQKQNPSFSNEKVEEFVYAKFNSLDTLISKGKWKNDYPINLLEAISEYKDVSEETINNWRTKYNKHLKANKKLRQIVNVFGETFRTANINDQELLKSKIGDYLQSLEELAPDLLSAESFQIEINISVMLNFLIRKYKDDRNLIIHGNFESLNHKWKNYINYSALLKVFITYKNYYDFYVK